MIEVAFAADNCCRVKVYATQPDSGKLLWVDTEHVFGDYDRYYGFYANYDLQEAAWVAENRYFTYYHGD
jgi:hypothetical protein